VEHHRFLGYTVGLVCLAVGVLTACNAPIARVEPIVQQTAHEINNPEPWLDYSLKRDSIFATILATLIFIIWKTRYSTEKKKYEEASKANGKAKTEATGEER